MFRRIDSQGNLIDTNEADNSIDPQLYWTGYYAQDYNTLVQKTKELVEKLSLQLSALIQGRK